MQTNFTRKILEKNTTIKAPDKSAYWKTSFFISHQKHMLWVHMLKLMDKKIIAFLRKLFLLNRPYAQ